MGAQAIESPAPGNRAVLQNGLASAGTGQQMPPDIQEFSALPSRRGVALGRGSFRAGQEQVESH